LPGKWSVRFLTGNGEGSGSVALELSIAVALPDVDASIVDIVVTVIDRPPVRQLRRRF